MYEKHELKRHHITISSSQHKYAPVVKFNKRSIEGPGLNSVLVWDHRTLIIPQVLAQIQELLHHLE